MTISPRIEPATHRITEFPIVDHLGEHDGNLNVETKTTEKPVVVDSPAALPTVFAIRQLMPRDPDEIDEASNDDLEIEADDDAVESGDGRAVAAQAATRSVVRGEANIRLRSVVGPRLQKARELSGLGQTEASLKLSYSTSAQLSQWEMSRRLPPLSELIKAATLYGVSLDFLTGESDEAERDPSMSLRNACLRAVRRQLERVAEVTVSEVARHARLVGPHVGNTRSLTAAGDELLDALGAYMRINAEGFANQRGGATLVRRSEEFEAALHDARSRIRLHDALDSDLRRAMAALGGADPIPPC